MAGGILSNRVEELATEEIVDLDAPELADKAIGILRCGRSIELRPHAGATATRSWRRAASVALESFWVGPRARHSSAARARECVGGGSSATLPTYPGQLTGSQRPSLVLSRPCTGPRVEPARNKARAGFDRAASPSPRPATFITWVVERSTWPRRR